MSDRLIQYQPYLQILCEAKPALCAAIIQNCPNDLLCVLTAIAENIINRNIPVNAEQLSNLQKSKTIVYKIADRDHSASEKRAYLSQSRVVNKLPLIIVPTLTALDEGLLL